MNCKLLYIKMFDQYMCTYILQDLSSKFTSSDSSIPQQSTIAYTPIQMTEIKQFLHVQLIFYGVIIYTNLPLCCSLPIYAY